MSAQPPGQSDPGEFRNLSLHVVCLADGSTVGIGEIFTLDTDGVTDPHNQALIQDGSIVNTGFWEDQLQQANVQAEEAAAEQASKEQPKSTKTTKKEGASA